MILIADSGSTKTDWVAIEGDKVVAQLQTRGLNPFFIDTMEISKLLSMEVAPHLPTTATTHVYFYGAGCTPERAHVVDNALLQHFDGERHVHSDMLAAARALCQRKPGLVAILGTGANSCAYDGERITANVSPLGYILGDEGSGAVLGRLFLGMLLKEQLPHELLNHFTTRYSLTTPQIIERVYRGADPNRFLASFAPFIHEHLYISKVSDMVREAFILFLQRNVARYPHYRDLPVHFTGSIAHYFSSILAEACTAEGVTLGDIVPAPLPRLITYHTTAV